MAGGANAVTLTYSTVNLGSIWRTNYTMTGTAPVGGYDGLTVYFSENIYSRLTGYLTPSGFDVLLVQPNTSVQAPGFIDLLNLAGPFVGEIAPVRFSVDFQLLGTAPPPGGQAFELYRLDPFQVVSSSTTVSGIPEPSTTSLLLPGLAALIAARWLLRKTKGRIYGLPPWIVSDSTALLFPSVLARVGGAAMVASLAACGGGSGSEASGGATVKALSVSTDAAAGDVSVVSIQKVLEARFDRTHFDYSYTVTVRNNSTAAYANLVIRLASVGAGVVVLSDKATISALSGGGTATSSDTVKIRVDRTVALDASMFLWQVDTSGPTPQQMLASLEDSGQIPKLERGDTIDGVDANGNGVRDDIEAFIASHYPAGPKQAATLQLAREMQSALHVPSGDVIAAKAVALRVSNAINCVFSRFPAGDALSAGKVARQIESVTTNTKPRLLAYLAYNHLLNGTASALPSGDTCA